MDFQINRGPMPQLPPQAPMLLMVPGFLLIGLGVFVLWNPALIPYLVAAVFFLLGGLLVFLARRMQRLLSR